MAFSSLSGCPHPEPSSVWPEDKQRKGEQGWWRGSWARWTSPLRRAVAVSPLQPHFISYIVCSSYQGHIGQMHPWKKGTLIKLFPDVCTRCFIAYFFHMTLDVLFPSCTLVWDLFCRHLILGPYKKEAQHAWFSLEATRPLLKILMIPVVYSQGMVRFSTVTIFLSNIFGWCSKCRAEKQET